MQRNHDKLNELERSLPAASNMELLRMIAREIVLVSRALDKERQAELAEATRQQHKLQDLLREALRAWLVRTPDVAEATTAWRMAQEAGLTK